MNDSTAEAAFPNHALGPSSEGVLRLLDLSNDAILVRDAADRITLWNRGAEQLYGWSRSEALGKISHELLHTRFPVPLPEIRQALHRNNRWEGETVQARRDGIRVVTLSRWVIATDDQGRPTGILETNTDVTQRKQPEEALKQQLELNATVTSNSTQAILMMDDCGYCTFINPAAEEMFGFTLDEIRSRPLHEMIHHHHPDGTPYPMSECPIDRALPENFDIREHEDIFIRKSGEFFPVLVAASPIFKDGKPVSTVIEVRDITERKKADKALAEAQLQLQRHATNLEQLVAERTAKLAEALVDLESFSYSVSHDLRAPLRAMQGFAQILYEEYASKLDDRAQDYIRRIVGASTRMDQLIHDVLAYSHVLRGNSPLVPVDLDKIIRGVIEAYPHLSAAEISVIGPLPSVLAHEAALTQCVSNLLGNAVKFVAAGVRPKVRVHAETSGEKVRLSVQDNGIGIAREQQQRIFQLHQRVNPEFEGTGIGLAIVRRAVERMGGTLGVESDVGAGSRFWVELRRA